MAVNLPPAERRYDRANENQARRLTEQAFADLYARLTAAEAALAAGVTPPPDPVGPTAGFTFQTNNLVANFADASTEGDTPIVSRLWDFGDGTQSTAPNNPSPSHTYPDAGTYNVTLTVTDENALQDTSPVSQVTVTKQPSGVGAPVFLNWGTEIRDMPAAYSWWNAHQAAAMSPGNCVAMLTAYADAGSSCFVRLWNDAGSKINGNFDMASWKASIMRYADAGLTNFLNQMAANNVIRNHTICDDINSIPRWGDPMTPAELEEMAAFSRATYFELEASVRARTSQLAGFSYNALQSCGSIYLFGRGGVSQGGLTAQQWRVADCEKYRDDELADAASLNNMPINFGLNVVNGGDGSSGIPGDGTPPDKWAMSANELDTYAGILVPANRLGPKAYFQIWERGSDGDQDSYFNRSDIQASMNGIRALCDAQ